MSTTRVFRMAAAAAACTAIAGGLLASPACAAPGQEVTYGSTRQDTLRGEAPRDLLIGTAVAGGGHHETMDYDNPFYASPEYRTVLAGEFSSVTPENQLKWEFVHPAQGEYNFGPTDDIVAFARANKQEVRGHTLLWHSQNPQWLERGEFTADELRAILKDHIQTVVGRYRGQIYQWDVANEIFDGRGSLRTMENIWIRELGPGIIADAFRWAHEADPEAKLFFNDYGVEGINAKSTAYYALAQDLLADGVPVHGFSAQAHWDMRWGLPGDMTANLQRFDDLGLETAITELDVRMTLPEDGRPTDEQLAQQATYYTETLQACLDVAGCKSFTLWGFNDQYSWVPVFFSGSGAATVMFEDFETKPAYDALVQQLEAATPGTSPRR